MGRVEEDLFAGRPDAGGLFKTDRPLPDEVASVIYLASIVVALTRCGKRITGLSDDGLRHGIAWALRQTWMHGRIGKLLKEGRRALVDPESAV